MKKTGIHWSKPGRKAYYMDIPVGGGGWSERVYFGKHSLIRKVLIGAFVALSGAGLFALFFRPNTLKTIAVPPLFPPSSPPTSTNSIS